MSKPRFNPEWFIAGLVSTLALASFARFEPWNAENDPRAFFGAAELAGKSIDFDFLAQPREGSIGYLPWADTSWPHANGSLAHRWAKVGDDGWRTESLVDRPDLGFNYASPGDAELLRMREDDLDELSPAEKTDIVLRYVFSDYPANYPFVAHERFRVARYWSRRGDDGKLESYTPVNVFSNPLWAKPAPFAGWPRARGSAEWEGFCDGWSTAALHYAEPKARRVRLPDFAGSGRELAFTFFSSDQKALLSHYYGVVRTLDVRRQFIGSRCKNPGDFSDPACRDTNAGAFHLALTNLIGRQRTGFIVDLGDGSDVHNFPAYRYEYSAEGPFALQPGDAAGPKAVRAYEVRMRVYFTDGIHPHRDALGRATPTFSKLFSYRAEVDRDGQVTGGTWRDGGVLPEGYHRRPDFIWIADKLPFREKAFRKLATLLNLGS